MGFFSRVKQSMEHTYFCLKKNEMDFEGQKLAFLIKNVIFTITIILSLTIGYHYQNFAIGCYIILAGSALASVLIIPTWPIYNRNPINWGNVEKEKVKEKKG